MPNFRFTAHVLAMVLPVCFFVFSGPLTAQIVVNEIMYHPPSHNPADEYIELLNNSSTNVNLSGWTLSGGINFIFPTNTVLGSGKYLVVAADGPTFASRYPTVTNFVGSWLTRTVMNVNGRLFTNATPVLSNTRNTINVNNIVGDRIDSVTYADEGDWAIRRRGLSDGGHRGWTWYAEHDGLGSSLELRNPNLPNQYGQNWIASPLNNPSPGRANAALVGNIPAMVVEVRHAPTIPRSTDPISITARVIDEFMAEVTVRLWYRIDSASPPPFSPVQMFDDGAHGDASAGDGIYGVVLPALMTNNTLVEFYVEATDEAGNVRTWPGPTLPAIDQGSTPVTQEANAMFQVDDQTYSGTPPMYKLIMTAAQMNELASLFNSAPNSDAEVNATFICIDSTGIDRHYLCSTRNRGHGSRNGTPHNYRLNIPSDDPWKGVTGFNINARVVPAQVVGAAIAQKAGAAGNRARFVQLRVNNGAGPGGTPPNGLYAGNEDISGDWAERQFPNNGEGNIYSVVRDIQPPNFNYRGEDPVSYQNTYFKQSNVSENDWQDIIGMLAVMGENQTGFFTVDLARQVADVDQWLLHLAVMNLFGNNESGINTGNNDDYYLYRGDRDPRFIMVYHDLDTILGEGGSMAANDANIFRATCCPVSGDSEGIWRAMNFFMHHPEIEPLYYRTLQNLLDTTFSQVQFDTIVDTIFADFPALAGTAANVKNWMSTRRSTVQSVISGFVPPPTENPFATISGEPRSPTWRTSATLTVGGAGISHYQWRLNNGAWNPQTPVATPITLSGFANGSTNTVYVVGRTTNGTWQSLTAPTVSRTWIVNTAMPTVRLNEVLARNDSAVNHNGTFPDVIELYNEGASSVNLSGLRVTDDPSNPDKFVFPPSTSLAAGAYLVLYANNPDGTPGFHLGFALEANGEGVFLFNAATNTVLDSVVFGPQLANFSIGRFGVSGAWSLAQPTFGAANVAQATASASSVRINEWMAIGTASTPDDFIELFNTGAQPIDLSRHYLTDNPLGFPNKHRIPELTFIGPGGYLVLVADGDAGKPDHVDFQLSAEQGEIGLFSPALTAIDCITYGPQSLGVANGRCPDGANSIKFLVVPTPGVANLCPATPIPPQTINILPLATTWRYNENTNLDGINWQAPGFNDSLWPSGQALFGTANIPAAQLQTPLTPGGNRITYYFRSSFNFPSNVAPTSLQLSNVIDDGAVFYINGREVGRYNLGSGPITYNTLATTVSGNPGWTGPIQIALTNVQPGSNSIAVEVHQNTTSSPDVFFGTRLDALIVTNNPVTAGVVINEVFASNASFTNAIGSTPDFIELYNPSSNAVDLVGMSLTDDTVADPRKWILGAGTIVPARGYLSLQFDADVLQSATNSGFGLSADGDRLYLLTAQTQVLDSVIFGLQTEDYSIGRVPNGSTNWVLTLPTIGTPNAAAPLGDFRQLKVNEWMPAPTSGDDWFELYNPEALPVAVGNCYLSDVVATPNKHQISPLSYLGAGTNAWKKFIADNNVAAGANHVGFKLDNTTEAVVFSDPNGGEIDSISYSGPQVGVSQGRLPDGTTTIVSFPGTDSAGEPNYVALTTLVINEVLTHTDLPLEDAIELHNLSASTVNAGGWWLSDSRRQLRKYQIRPGTSIPPGGFIVFYEAQFNNSDQAAVPFALSSKGDQVFLSATLGNGLLSGFRSTAEFGASANGVSFGRYQNSAGQVDYPAASRRTFGHDSALSVQDFRNGTGLANAYPRVGPVVISEVMYHPPDIAGGDNVGDEFIELHNITANMVTLYDPANPTNTWRLRDAVDFEFAPGTSLAPDGNLLVVSFDPATNTTALASFRTTYGTNFTLVGPYRGKLDNSSDNVELYRPDSPDPGGVPYVLVERVKYRDVAPWPLAADGFGSSLQRVSTTGYANDPTNWIAAAPTPAPSGSTDTDHDGMPDAWEDANGLQKNVNDAGLDRDGDGMTNYQEYLAGTDPRNNQSYLKITSIANAPGTRMIDFNAIAGLTYSIIYRPNVQAGTWTKLIDVPAQSTTQAMRVFDPSGDPRRFYRLVTPSLANP